MSSLYSFLCLLLSYLFHRIKYLLSRAADGKNVAVLVASHNELSADSAVEYMKGRGMSLTDHRVHFAQLMVVNFIIIILCPPLNLSV